NRDYTGMWVRLGSTDLMAGKVMFLRSNQGGRFDGNESVADSFRSDLVNFKSSCTTILGAFYSFFVCQKNLHFREAHLLPEVNPIRRSLPLSKLRDRKPRLIVENREDCSHQEDNEPDEGSGQANKRLWSTVMGMKKPKRMQISHFRSYCRVVVTAHRNSWFTNDGATAHFSIILDATYLGRGTERDGPVALPPRFPDLNPLDFFFWSHLNFTCV
ncbi:hypothetical protein TNCV_1217591, partial [Trichonephila clavipes]